MDPTSNVIVENVIELLTLFGDVATGEALAPLLLVVGGLLVAVTLGAFGVMALGGVASLFRLG